jgi:hypothetical protein
MKKLMKNVLSKKDDVVKRLSVKIGGGGTLEKNPRFSDI